MTNATPVSSWSGLQIPQVLPKLPSDKRRESGFRPAMSPSSRAPVSAGRGIGDGKGESGEGAYHFREQ